ncbi:hypothetical protein, partial [Enterococcus faecalis]|uniref:hypothetical protein n=1 Tax=Enterococcus faecalis TaxID=1351 RepID=UPI0039854F0E
IQIIPAHDSIKSIIIIVLSFFWLNKYRQPLTILLLGEFFSRMTELAWPCGRQNKRERRDVNNKKIVSIMVYPSPKNAIMRPPKDQPTN